MNVCMLIRSYAPGPEGGVEKQCRRLVAALERQGVRCTVVTHWSRGSAPRRERSGGARIRRAGWLGPLTRRAEELRDRVRGPKSPVQGAGAADAGDRAGFRPLAPLRWLDRLLFMIEASAIMKRGGFDVLHVHESHWLAGFGAWVGHRYGIPVVCKESTWPALPPAELDVPFGRVWERWRRRPWFIATGPHIRDSLLERGIAADRIFVVPNGVEIPQDTAKLESKDVLCVGNLWQGAEWKGFDVLLDAWGRVHAAEPSARLVMVGGGDAGPWQARARELGCEGSVVFEGRVEDPAPYCRQASVFVLPSRTEGLSNALLEAQSWGVPAVVSGIPGNRVVVENHVNGLVVPVGDALPLAHALLKLLGEPMTREAMGRAAQMRMRELFAMDQVARRLEEAYRAIRRRNS